MMVAAILSVSSNVYAQCQFHKVVEADIIIKDGVAFVPVKINGNDALFVFSNRSNVTSLYKDSVEKIGLKPYDTRFFTNEDGGEKFVSGVHIASFQIENAPPYTDDFFVTDGAHRIHPESWGFLNTSLFPGDAIEFDYGNRKIAAYSEQHCEGSQLAKWGGSIGVAKIHRDDLATFTGEVEGRPVNVEINSSQPVSTINESAVRIFKLRTIDNKKGVDRAADVPSHKKNEWNTYLDKSAFVSEMKIASEIFTNVKVLIQPDSHGAWREGKPVGQPMNHDQAAPKIVLGIDYLLAHHVLISPAQHLAYISTSGETNFDGTAASAGSAEASKSP